MVLLKWFVPIADGRFPDRRLLTAAEQWPEFTQGILWLFDEFGARSRFCELLVGLAALCLPVPVVLAIADAALRRVCAERIVQRLTLHYRWSVAKRVLDKARESEGAVSNVQSARRSLSTKT